MRFHVVPRDASPSSEVERPCVFLHRDRWNDYGFVTQFRASYSASTDAEEQKLGDVKIMHRGLRPDKTPVEVPDSFFALDETYGSLGQTVEYYERVGALGATAARTVLEGLRDLAVRPNRRAVFEQESAYETSLLRDTGAVRSLKIAPTLFPDLAGIGPAPLSPDTDFSFRFFTRVEGAAAPHEIPFDFKPEPDLPHRLNVIVGRNGTGKTRVMANLAVVQSGVPSDPETPLQDYGSMSPGRQPYAKVGAVSYSAFDAFALPGGEDSDGDNVDSAADTERNGYFYVGIRAPDRRFRTFGELQSMFGAAQDLILEADRGAQWASVLQPVLSDPAFSVKTVTELTGAYDAFGSGQRAILSILTELVARLDEQSLVLVDEPENHLHPPLVAAFLHGLRRALDLFDSYAVVATHSPVIVQETPARYVHVFSRLGLYPHVRHPRIETFGEDLGRITEEVFELSLDDASFLDTLRAWAGSGRSVESIEAELGYPMSYPARSFFLGLARPHA